MSADAALARRLLDFEHELSAATTERLVEGDWGRAFLSPGLANVWDANAIALEATGMAMRDVASLADEVLGGAGLEHRTVYACDAADGVRLEGEIGDAPGWQVERTEYMVWDGDKAPSSSVAVREAPLSEAASLRAELMSEWLPDGPDQAETIEQLLELGRRDGRVAGDRWFLAPADDLAAACCLLAGAGIGQVEDVGTLERARGQGLATAVVVAAARASREAGHEVTFVAADADDWPRLLYAKLGFRKVGEFRALRRLRQQG